MSGTVKDPPPPGGAETRSEQGACSHGAAHLAGLATTAFDCAVFGAFGTITVVTKLLAHMLFI